MSILLRQVVNGARLFGSSSSSTAAISSLGCRHASTYHNQSPWVSVDGRSQFTGSVVCDVCKLYNFNRLRRGECSSFREVLNLKKQTIFECWCRSGRRRLVRLTIMMGLDDGTAAVQMPGRKRRKWMWNRKWSRFIWYRHRILQHFGAHFVTFFVFPAADKSWGTAERQWGTAQSV